jgi:hypothetical protein
MQSLNHIDELVTAAKAAGLDGLEFLDLFDRATLAREYNGIGPEWAGEKIRAKVTQHLDLFEPAALIHDLRNFKSDGSRYGFNFANIEFHDNCLKIADAKYPWYSWRRYRARVVAHALYDFVRGEGGWKAWIDCCCKTKERENQ